MTNPKQLLIIDDDPDFRELVRLAAETVGYSAVTAPNCSAGLEMLQRQKEKIGLVFLDYLMPGLAPSVCADCIRDIVGTEIPVVLVTASVSPGDLAKKLGLHNWLAKPFDLDRLIEVIETGRGNPC